MSIFGGGYGPGGYGGGTRRSGCGMLIGAAIIVIGIISYAMKTSVNPVTGEKQRVSLTPEQETALGLQAAPEMVAKMGGEVDPRDPDAQTVQRIGSHLVANSVARQSPYQYRFHLLRDPQTINAFALPGGQVFITRALYEKLQDEASLGGVLGHEIGHVVNRHSAEQMAKGQLGQMIVTGIGVAASDRRDGGYAAAVLAQVAEQQIMMKFSRSDENEADSFGLRIMTEAGFDPQAMIDVMKVLEQASKGGRPPEFMATHPYPEHRIEAIQRWLREHPQEAKQLTRGKPLH